MMCEQKDCFKAATKQIFTDERVFDLCKKHYKEQIKKDKTILLNKRK